MRKTKFLTYGIIGTMIFLLPGIVSLIIALVMTFSGNNSDNQALKVLFYAGLAFLALGSFNFIAVLLAPTNRFMRGVMLTFTIIMLLSGGIFGICDIISYKYLRDYLEYGEEYRMSRKEKRRLKRQRKEELRHRKKTDSAFAKYLKHLKGRKVRALLKGLLLWIISFIISIPGFIIYMKYLLVYLEDSVLGFLVPFVAYILLAIVFLLINKVQIGFSATDSQTTVTDTYKYQKNEGIFFSSEGWEKVDSKTETKETTFYFFTWKTLLFFLLGWLMFVPVTIGLLINIFTKYDSEKRVCGLHPSKIPSRYLRSPYEVASLTSFFMGFVAINYGYLDYVYEIANRPKSRRRLR